jgi:hypothetical protein
VSDDAEYFAHFIDTSKHTGTGVTRKPPAWTEERGEISSNSCTGAGSEHPWYVPVSIGNCQPGLTLALATGPVTLTRKLRALPSALSSTITNDAEVTATLQPALTGDQGWPLVTRESQVTLPHAPFELRLPDSIPKPPRITNNSLQELMGLKDNGPLWYSMKASKPQLVLTIARWLTNFSLRLLSGGTWPQQVSCTNRNTARMANHPRSGVRHGLITELLPLS